RWGNGFGRIRLCRTRPPVDTLCLQAYRQQCFGLFQAVSLIVGMAANEFGYAEVVARISNRRPPFLGNGCR
ncbi:MAG: hypothetical protein AAB403_04340, partial [Planctomycetota bacterium]